MNRFKIYTIVCLGLISCVFILWRLSTTIYTSEITRFNPLNEIGEPKLNGSILFEDADNAAWLLTAQEAARNKLNRIHDIQWDGYPTGRKTHWATPLTLSLVLAGKIAEKITGQPQNLAIESAAPYVYTGIFILFAILGAILAVAGFGAYNGALLYLMLFFTPSLFWGYFQPLRVDHHAIILFGITVCYAGLIKALGSETYKECKAGLLASAIGAGFSIWISAISAIPAIVVPAFGVGCVAVFARYNKAYKIEHPNLWLLWGKTIAIIILLAYLVEYYPAFPLRMEVNNPLFAISVLGGASILRWLILAQDTEWRPKPLAVIRISIDVLACLFPILILLYFKGDIFSPLTTFWTRIPHMVAEGLPMPVDTVFSMGLIGVILLGILVAAAIIGVGNWKVLVPMALATSIYTLLAMSAKRMYPNWLLLIIVLELAVVFYQPANWHKVIKAIRLLLTIHIILGSIALAQLIQQEARTGRKNTIQNATEARKAAEVIVDDAKKTNTPIIITSHPDTATFLGYYTGGQISAGIYWEAMENWKSVIDLLYTENEETARIGLSQLQSTYLVIPKSTTDNWAYLKDGIKGLYPSNLYFENILRAGKEIDWLQPIESSNNFLIFRIKTHKISTQDQVQ